MDAANFALEFMQLLMRYTTPKKITSENNEKADISRPPLSTETVIQVVQETLSTIVPEPYLPNIDINGNKTPANDIIINTPDAPFVQRINNNENGIISECTDSLSDKLSPICKKDEFTLKETGRSGTFVQDNNKDNNSNTDEIFKEITDDMFLEAENVPPYVRLKLGDLRKSAFEVISKIDEINAVNKDGKQQSMEKTLRPIRRLSAIGSYSGIRTSILRSEQPLKKRRSFINFPNATPTSSRLNSTVTLSPNLSKRKSSSAVSLNVTTAVTVSAKSSPQTNSNVRSRSSLCPTGLKKSLLIDSRPAKNPKYAHIQSSIPKPTPIVRKSS